MSQVLEVRGGRELDTMLRRLPEAMQREVLGPALEAGGGIIQSGMVARVRRRTGELARRIMLAVTVEGPGGTVAVGPDKNTDFRARFLEFGTKPHKIPKRRRRKKDRKVLASKDQVFGFAAEHPGHAAFPFMRPALDEDGPRAVQVFARRLWDGLVAVTQRLKGA